VHGNAAAHRSAFPGWQNPEGVIRMYNLVLIDNGKEDVIYNTDNYQIARLEREKHLRGQRPGIVEIREEETGKKVE
jgi:hypothetical protein